MTPAQSESQIDARRNGQTIAIPLAVLQVFTTSSISVLRASEESLRSRGRKNRTMNSDEPTQKAPDTIWMILKLMNSMFISAHVICVTMGRCTPPLTVIGRFSGPDACDSPVDHKLGACHERRFVRRQVKGPVRNVCRLTEPSKRYLADSLFR